MTQIAVVDVETTGLTPYRHDRIVELAAVVIGEDGRVVRELSTLVNPDRDMGPTRVHGLTAKDVLGAPRFGELAGTFIAFLDGCVAVAGHNVRFDLSFLAAEFDRIGYRFPDCQSLDTMQLAGGGSLARTCSDYGIAVDGEAHTALHDARSAAQLLAVLLRGAPDLAATVLASAPIVWCDIPKSPASLLTREEARERQASVEQVAAAASDLAHTPGGLIGKHVCFTGECQCRVGGRPLTREMAAALATRYGIIVTESVTRKLDVLVAADPFTQSGKAKKARQYGIPIMHELAFWRVLGMEVG